MKPKTDSSEYFTGRQYHIACAPGDLKSTILLCGDPARGRKVIRHFSEITFKAQHREYVTYTGIFEGVPVSVMSTGIGTDNTEIAVIEISQCFPKDAKLTFIRIGSCGALQKDIAIGDLVISSDAIRRENTSDFYAPRSLKPKSDPEVLAALQKAARALEIKHFTGTTCSTSSFYGGQGREVPGFPIRDKNVISRLSKQGVLNLEMETSLLFTLAHIAEPKGHLRAGSVCAVYANRVQQMGFDQKQIKRAERNCIRVGLLAAKLLSRPR